MKSAVLQSKWKFHVEIPKFHLGINTNAFRKERQAHFSKTIPENKPNSEVLFSSH